ncbi:MAG TPA: cyclopropane-fatty-acyl-phospholipid synthase family protein [Mycobacterium sp.]|jgi:cyclopropane-fatty-acyl-phospholipid synthase|uniref:cyclopropane-fatty-acyl-phospholipid synthase family protein n=1 Tax=Mycobacterium sp. TaxID=1785 RepID=UPI002BDE7CB1|nr:cyclopropane-fatty-acyl-phospholipid synthase family protein [Mycobacterium sp.]HXO82772.1 cyclopropane-fatty-acyl-phospholipid synthase family protein [Mycobacterium sp.]
MSETYLGAGSGAIRHHYDVGNDFWQVWLDPTMSYSCAMWVDPADDLETAQRRKLDFHAEQAHATGAARVLDIGCGWGAQLMHLVGSQDVKHAVGLTLSDAQAEYLRALAPSNVEVLVRSWSDYEPTEPFDAVISVGAFEHFARQGLSAEEQVEAYRRFFGACRNWLKPGGRLSLQTIAYGDIPRDRPLRDRFIVDEIFPESELPRLADIARAAEMELEIERVRNDRDDYVKTLRAWLGRIKERRDDAIAASSEETVARYERYLRMFAYSMELGAFTLLRLTMRRIDLPGRW